MARGGDKLGEIVGYITALYWQKWNKLVDLDHIERRMSKHQIRQTDCLYCDTIYLETSSDHTAQPRRL